MWEPAKRPNNICSIGELEAEERVNVTVNNSKVYWPGFLKMMKDIEPEMQEVL